MKMRALSLCLFAGLLCAATSAQAVVANGWNLLAPGVCVFGGVEQVAVRNPNTGQIWYKETYPTASAWVNVGSPSGGSSSGPQIFHFKDFASNITYTYILVRGPYPSDTAGNIWETHKASNGLFWSAWSSSKFNAPPGGTTAGFAAAAAGGTSEDSTSLAAIVVRGTNNVPWIRWLQSSAGAGAATLTPWAQLTGQIDLAPGVAITLGRTDLIAWKLGAEQLQRNTCQNGLCSGWSNFGGATSVQNMSSPAAIWSSHFFTVGILETVPEPFEYVSDVWAGTLFANDVGDNNYSVQFDGTPAPGIDLTSGGLQATPTGWNGLIAHRTDGNWYRSTGGQNGAVWTSIGHP